MWGTRITNCGSVGGYLRSGKFFDFSRFISTPNLLVTIFTLYCCSPISYKMFFSVFPSLFLLMDSVLLFCIITEQTVTVRIPLGFSQIGATNLPRYQNTFESVCFRIQERYRGLFFSASSHPSLQDYQVSTWAEVEVTVKENLHFWDLRCPSRCQSQCCKKNLMQQ